MLTKSLSIGLDLPDRLGKDSVPLSRPAPGSPAAGAGPRRGHRHCPPPHRAAGNPVSKTRARSRHAHCGLVAKAVSGARPTTCRRADASVQARGR